VINDDVDEDEEISSEIRSFSNYTYNDYFNNSITSVYLTTVWLTFLTHLVCMRPNFQGLLCFEFDGHGEDNY
jgi:hypothetical protein